MNPLKGVALQSDEEIPSAKPERFGCILRYRMNCRAVLQLRRADTVKRPRLTRFRMNAQHNSVLAIASSKPEEPLRAFKKHVYRKRILP